MSNLIKKQTIGVEVEFNGITRKAAMAAVAAEMGWTVPQYTTSYRTWYSFDNQGRKWKIVRDASVYGPDDEKCELVTPILKYEDIEMLQEVIRIIRNAGGKPHRSCGVHVHVGKDKHNAKSLRNLINIMHSKEDMIYPALGISSERASRWAKKTRPSLVENVNKKKPKTVRELGDLWYEGFGWGGHYNNSRYYGLNLHNVWYAQTVEFRLFNASLHAGKIKAYVQFVLAVSAQAIEQKSARSKKTETTNPKYTFRTWLLRLGLNGDEFKTCRHHMLAKLEGDIAWRNGRPA